MKSRVLTALVSATLLGGCLVGPDFAPPEPGVPESFGNAEAASGPITVDLTKWWETFGDAELKRLVEEAVQSNLDLKLADGRVREARALAGIQWAGLLPSFNTTESVTRSRNSRNGLAITGSGAANGAGNGAGSGASAGTTTPNALATQALTLYDAGFDSVWEVDVFGGQRRAIEAAEYSIEAQREELRNTLVTLMSEVAANYIALRGVQFELETVRRNAAAQRETLDLQRLKLTAGIANDLTVAQAEAQLASTEARLPALESREKQAIHRLSVLLGREPNALAGELSVPAPIPRGPAVIPAGLPSDLLKRRPDVRRAEREFAAATANIGTATADLFPRFSLTGRAGLRSRDTSNFAEKDSTYFSVAPTFSWPLLALGAVYENVQVQNARQEQSLIAYRSTVLKAIEEVENAIVLHDREQERRAGLLRSAEANRRALALARELYDAGVVDFLNVLSAQQSLYLAEQELAQSEQQVSTNLVALYKALGGGWESVELETNG